MTTLIKKLEALMIHAEQYGNGTVSITLLRQAVNEAVRSQDELPSDDDLDDNEWMPLAQALCKEEWGDDYNKLIYEGYPSEPWGERWLRYEDEAKRMIKLVRTYALTAINFRSKR